MIFELLLLLLIFIVHLPKHILSHDYDGPFSFLCIDNVYKEVWVKRRINKKSPKAL